MKIRDIPSNAKRTAKEFADAAKNQTDLVKGGLVIGIILALVVITAFLLSGCNNQTSKRLKPITVIFAGWREPALTHSVYVVTVDGKDHQGVAICPK